MRSRRWGPVALIALCLLGLLFTSSAEASGGIVKGWGQDEYGQADGSPVSSGCLCVEAPSTVNGLSGVTQVAGGLYYGLALLSNGTVMAWGQNESGQLGDGTTTDSATPIAVPGLVNVIAVAAGGEDSLALLSNGTVMAWGDNRDGELGNGTAPGPETCHAVPCSKKPVPVAALSNVVAIAGGYFYNVALLADGTVVAWGLDQLGETGDGTGMLGGCACVGHPTVVPGVSGAVAISAGQYVASALLRDGTVKDWGHNYEGALGNGTATRTSSSGCYCLGPVSASGLSGARATASGGDHGLALLASGGAEAWGNDESGQVGNGSFASNECGCVTTPTQVTRLSGAQAVAAGAYHSLALLSDGTVVAWGWNVDGQLGNGTLEKRASPVPASGLSGVSAIEANEAQSYAIVGPSQALNVALAGAGAGTVGGQGVLCPPSCTGRYPQGQVVILRAEPSPGSGFAGFSGPCAGVGPCRLSLGEDQSVTATFGPPKGTAITRATILSRKRKASFSFSAPGAVTGFECKLLRPKPRRRRAVRKRAGRRLLSGTRRKPSFSPCSSMKVFRHLVPGHYTFAVRALDILGADPVPATRRFKINRSRCRSASRCRR